ncbi:transposase, IS204/IS1001/IS1096/IS1165 family protein, partial [mine drainage metagenome]
AAQNGRTPLSYRLLPQALPCFDPFHLIKLANKAVDAVRRAEVAQEPALKHTRYHWLKDASDWTRKEIDLHWLRHSGLKTARAWRLKERLRDILAWRRYPQVPVLLLMDGWIRLGTALPIARLQTPGQDLSDPSGRHPQHARPRHHLQRRRRVDQCRYPGRRRPRPRLPHLPQSAH